MLHCRLGFVEAISTIVTNYLQWINGSFIDSIGRISKKEEMAINVATNSGDAKKLVTCRFNIPNVKQAILFEMIKNIQKSSSNLKQRKLDFVSYLMKKEANDLYSFSWDEVFLEAVQTMPELVSIIAAVMMKDNMMRNKDLLSQVILKTSMIYFIIVNNYNPELSLVKRVMTVVLHDNCYDRAVSGFKTINFYL